MTPRPVRMCGVIDCHRSHYARGYCQRHYMADYRARKARASRKTTDAVRNGYPASTSAETAA